MPDAVAPASAGEAAAVLAEAAGRGAVVRFRGGGTKLGWGGVGPEPDVLVRTDRLDGVLEHNAGDLTAVLQAGVPMARAQALFAGSGQMLALDPPLGHGEAATVGGVMAAGDSGPLRHRYGAARDLVLGVSVALSDGTVAKAGGKVIKNVAGYDLAKLFAGSFGTLGMILEVAVRLHPLPARTATACGASPDPAALRAAALAVAHAPLELECLDVGWDGGVGRVLARAGGAAPEPRAERAAALMAEAGLETSAVASDPASGSAEDALWDAQRRGQRSERGAVVRVSGVATDVATVLEGACRVGATVVGRPGVGLFWLALPAAGPGELAAAIGELRSALGPRPCLVLDAPSEVRAGLDVWDERDPVRLDLTRRLKARFDPAGVCNRGRFVGGI